MAIAMTPRCRGQALVFFALALPLALLPLAAYAAETPMLAARQARLAEATSLAALDAAQQLDIARFRAGRGTGLDPDAAAASAKVDLAAAEPEAVVDSVAVDGPRVTIATHLQVPLRLATFVRGASVTLRATATARLVPGYQEPG
jgi:hypothetical protein